MIEHLPSSFPFRPPNRNRRQSGRRGESWSHRRVVEILLRLRAKSVCLRAARKFAFYRRARSDTDCCCHRDRHPSAEPTDRLTPWIRAPHHLPLGSTTYAEGASYWYKHIGNRYVCTNNWPYAEGPIRSRRNRRSRFPCFGFTHYRTAGKSWRSDAQSNAGRSGRRGVAVTDDVRSVPSVLAACRLVN